MAFGTRVPFHSLTAAAGASRETGKPSRVQAPNPPSSSRTDAMAEVLEKPERAGGANPRLIVVDDDRRRRLDAAGREQVLDHPHERLERRRVGVDEADAEQIEMNGAVDVSGGVGLGRPEVDEQGTGRARLADGSRQFLGRDQQLGVRIPFHPGIVQQSLIPIADPESLIPIPISLISNPNRRSGTRDRD